MAAQGKGQDQAKSESNNDRKKTMARRQGRSAGRHTFTTEVLGANETPVITQYVSIARSKQNEVPAQEP